MFESALKGTRSSKGTKKWKTFSGKDANRWKKEGSVQSMMRLRKTKKAW